MVSGVTCPAATAAFHCSDVAHDMKFKHWLAFKVSFVYIHRNIENFSQHSASSNEQLVIIRCSD